MKKIVFLLLYFPSVLFSDLHTASSEETCPAASESDFLIEYDTIVNSDSFTSVYTETPTIFTWRAPGEYFWRYALEFRVGGNRPSNSKVLKIYGRNIEYEVEGTWRKCFYEFDGWINLSYLSQTGHFHEKHHHGNDKEHSRKTRLQIYPVSFGLKRTCYLSDNFYFYVGLGANCANVQGNFFSDHRHVHKQAWGAVVKGGVLYDFNCGIYFDCYCDYYYMALTSRGDTVNVGGVRAGFGIGFNY